MTLAHVNKSYLESNLMAAPPSSQLVLDSLYADLQVHALSVSDGLSKVQASLGTDSLTTLSRDERVYHCDERRIQIGAAAVRRIRRTAAVRGAVATSHGISLVPGRPDSDGYLGSRVRGVAERLNWGGTS